MTMTRSEVYAAINSERNYQDMRRKRDQGQPTHSVADYLLYMEDYLTEARKVASRTWGPTADALTMEVVRKVVALGVAAAEEHGMMQREGFDVIPMEVRIEHLSQTITRAGLMVNPDEDGIAAATRIIPNFGAGDASVKVTQPAPVKPGT